MNKIRIALGRFISRYFSNFEQRVKNPEADLFENSILTYEEIDVYFWRLSYNDEIKIRFYEKLKKE